ncbi:MAG: hypothetical protein M0R33_13865 [Methylomonas sp.]|jgi:hypothetical protein|uniref:hypothetical protein n=1 Tax=Methylomonas sp. TaxID=418 RepID=UPI0025E676C2|nr:hypothetical protein [Methylomonas sp.]MCK9607522.1 hypothetical protein [Methylomonas sp.]
MKRGAHLLELPSESQIQEYHPFLQKLITRLQTIDASFSKPREINFQVEISLSPSQEECEWQNDIALIINNFTLMRRDCYDTVSAFHRRSADCEQADIPDDASTYFDEILAKTSQKNQLTRRCILNAAHLYRQFPRIIAAFPIGEIIDTEFAFGSSATREFGGASSATREFAFGSSATRELFPSEKLTLILLDVTIHDPIVVQLRRLLAKPIPIAIETK